MGTNDQPQYLTTAQAAAALAVSVSTVKRWVDEGILPAHVTTGGHRKLLRSEVLTLVRQGNLPRSDPAVIGGMSPGGVASTDPKAISSALLDALVGGNGTDAKALLRRAYQSGVSIETLADLVIAPAMATLGHQWETAHIDVWQEHRGTQLCAAALFELKRELESRAERNRPVAIGAAPEGDHYVLPTLLGQLVLLDSGWEAINLGPNTPLASLTKAVQELRPRMVWLSGSYIRNNEEFLGAYSQLYRAAEQQGVAVAVGGQALVEGIRSAMIYTTFGDGLSHLAAFARTLHPRPKRPRKGRPRADSQ